MTIMREQIMGIRTGTRLACGMLIGSIRTGQTFYGLLCLIAVCLIYYVDVIIRTLFGGGSFIAWAIINLCKLKGFPIDTKLFGILWLLHLPEYLIVFMLFALISLMMVHVVHNILNDTKCGIGRSFFRALRSWRFILVYAFFMSGMTWAFGDVYLNVIRCMVAYLAKISVLMEYLYDPTYGKKIMDFFLVNPYSISSSVCMAVTTIWYLGTFLLFPIVALEQCSFIQGVYRSFLLTFYNMGLVMSAALSYMMLYAGVIALTLYSQAATCPSLEGIGTKGNVQVIALFAFMALILFTVHSAIVMSGSLIARVLLYRMAVGDKLRIRHTSLYVRRPYCSCFLYLMFYLFYWIIIRCGIHVQMPII